MNMKRPVSPDGTGGKKQKTKTKENNDKNDCLMDDEDDDHIRYQLRSSSNVTPAGQPTAQSRKKQRLQNKIRKRSAKTAKKRRLQRARLSQQHHANDESRAESCPAAEVPLSADENSLVDTQEGDNLLVRFDKQSHDSTSESNGSDAAETFWTRLSWTFFCWISGTSQRVWLVPDTNFFMQDKTIMQEIKEKLTTKLGTGFYLGVSYTVVRELDAIKNDRNNKKTQAERNLARQAIILLCQWFDNGDVCVKGENPYETAYIRSKMAFPPLITNNDDQISEWCLQLRVKYGQSVVALLSEDKGFRVKANLHGIKAFSIVMLTDWLSSSSSSF